MGLATQQSTTRFIPHCEVVTVVMLLIVYLSLALADSTWVSSVRAQETGELSIEELQAIWASQRSEIVSAHIRYRRFHQADIFAALDPDEVKAVLESYDLVTHPEHLVSFINELIASPPFSATPPFAVREFWLQGEKRRDDSGTSSDVLDGATRLRTNATNNQVLLLEAGDSMVHVRALEDFRHVPGQDLDPQMLRTRVRERGRVVLAVVGPDSDIDTTTMIVNEASGVVERVTTRLDDGQIYRERFFEGFRAYSGNILFPTVVVVAQYWRNAISQLTVLLIDEAQFNQPVADSAFAVRVPQGTAVFDRRKGPERFVYAPAGTDNVKRLMDEGQEVASTTAWKPTRSYVVLLSGLLLVAFSVYLWRNSRPAAKLKRQ